MTLTGNKPSGDEQERIVIVLRKRYLVRVLRLSRTERIVVGECLGRTIEAKGRTEGAALENWERVATFWGSG